MYWKASATDWIRSSCLMAVMSNSGLVVFLMLQGKGLGHGFVYHRHGQGGKQENDMNDDLPLQRVLGQVGSIDETFQQVNRRNADDGRRKLDLEHAGIDVGKPLGLVGMLFQVEAGDKSFVAADDHHDQQIGDHHHVDQAEDGQHDVDFGEVSGVDGPMDEVAQFDHEQPAIDDLGDDQADIERCLNPAAGENERFQVSDGQIGR